MGVSLQHLVRAFVVAVTAVLLIPGPGLAGDPPDRNDPCSRMGRNTCGTVGVGSYETYRYGVRWFGDYRDVVPGAGHAYCIDLRYWYPNPRSRFREDTSAMLENRDGEPVPLERRRRMAYAVWAYGRTTQPSQAAAVMLYVHGLMGDAAPGEVAPDAIGPTVAETYGRVARDAARYHGPYRIEARLPTRLREGTTVAGSVRVLSATGNALPGVGLRLDAPGSTGLPARLETNANGVAKISFTPSASGALRLRLRTETVASTLPRIYAPTRPAAARNGQRIVVPASQVVTETVDRTVALQPRLKTVVSARRIAPGSTVTDTIEVSGLGDETATIRAALYGPFPARETITCTGRPVWTGTLEVTGDGSYFTAPVQLDIAGFYTYRETIASSDVVGGVETPCGDVAETTAVVATPTLATRVSTQSATPGSTITDSVVVSGIGSLRLVIAAELYGPFETRADIRCEGAPVWRGTVEADGDGTYETAPFRLERAGYYTYRESIVEGPANAAVTTQCATAAETTLVRARPAVSTVASSEVVVPGGRLHDRVRVTGLGSGSAAVELELFGPFASRAAIRCAGSAIWSGRFTVHGDGIHDSPAVKLERAGFYAYRERLVTSALVTGGRSACGATSETALVRPLIVTGGAAASVGRAASASGDRAPVRVRIPTLGIDAPLTPSVVDVANGVLGVPDDIRRPGWWRDGAVPGDRAGAVLVAGHVDSATRGAGAFFGLQTARRGTRVELRTRNGRTKEYRVVSVRLMPKEKLPADIYSRRGRPRLVLVTCGGPFDEARRHYRDNVVVTAVPV
jgi:hypothetical protein